MPLVKIKQNYQITIPRELRKKFNVLVGDYLEIESQKEGLVIKPVRVIHPDRNYSANFHPPLLRAGKIRQFATEYHL